MPQTIAAGSAPTPQEQILELTLGYWKSWALAVAAELGLADLLAESGTGPAQPSLGAETRSVRPRQALLCREFLRSPAASRCPRPAHQHRRSLFRLMRALESV